MSHGWIQERDAVIDPEEDTFPKPRPSQPKGSLKSERPNHQHSFSYEDTLRDEQPPHRVDTTDISREHLM